MIQVFYLQTLAWSSSRIASLGLFLLEPMPLHVQLLHKSAFELVENTMIWMKWERALGTTLSLKC
jgi:hypothetical protein